MFHPNLINLCSDVILFPSPGCKGTGVTMVGTPQTLGGTTATYKTYPGTLLPFAILASILADVVVLIVFVFKKLTQVRIRTAHLRFV